MTCLVCDNVIQITGLRQLFSTEPLILCGRCESQMIAHQSAHILYERNEFMDGLIDRLGRGDVALAEVFVGELVKVCKKLKVPVTSVGATYDEEGVVYPWLDVLVAKVALKKESERKEMKLWSLKVRALANDEGCVGIVEG